MGTRARVALELGVLEAATVAVFAGLWRAERALWSNGLVPAERFSYPRLGADVAAGSQQAAGVVWLGLAACALFVWLVVRAARFDRPVLRVVAVGVPAAIAVGLFLLPPALSIDAYSYLSHGYLAATPESNPYLDTSGSVGSTPYGAALLAQGWQPVHPQTPYGPLWTRIEQGAYLLSGGSVPVGILLIKLPDLLALLGTAAMIGAAVPRPRRLRAVLLYLANPLVLVELAGEGHNDGLMACLVVAAIVLALRRRAAASVLALGLAVLVKPNALPFLLPVAVALIAFRRSTARLALEAAIGVVVAAAVGVVTVLPFWAGWATLQGVQASGAVSPGWSPAGLLASLLDPQPAGFGPAASTTGVSPAQVVLLVALVIGTAFAALLARTPQGLVRACGLTAVWSFLLLPLEWPWYAVLAAAVLPLEAGAIDVVVVAALAVGSRLIAPIGDAATVGVVGPDLFRTEQALIGQTIPGALGVLLLAGRALLPDLRRAHPGRKERRPADARVAG